MKDWEIILLSYCGLLGIMIVGTIVVYRYDTNQMFFWLAILYATGVLIATTYVSRKLSERTDRKIDDVLERVKQIQERLEGLHKK